MVRPQWAGGLVGIHAKHPEIHQHMRRRPFVKDLEGLGPVVSDPHLSSHHREEHVTPAYG
jgi:hypothetical protein